MSYQPLLHGDRDGKAESLEEALRQETDPGRYTRGSSQSPHRRRRRETYALIVSVLLNFAFMYGCAMLYQQKEAINPNVFWTPFNDQLRYHAQVFTSGFGHDVSAWQGNASARKDALWQDSYVEAFTVRASAAARLANKTVPATADVDAGYVTSFAVFHHLHCLDMVRQLAEHIYFPAHVGLNATHNLGANRDTLPGFERHGRFSHEHIDHCIDGLRQALRCKPDLGPVVWQWAPKPRESARARQLAVFAETAHSCANFDDLLAYARERRFDAEVYGDTELPMLGQCAFEDQDCR